MGFVLGIAALFFAFVGNLLSPIASFFEPEIYSPCSPPIRYQIGTIDKQFKMPRENLLSYINKAEKVWEDNYGKEIFVYDPEGTVSSSERLITINMVYDERQQLNSQVRQLEGRLQGENKKVKTSIAEYEARVKSFNQRSEELSNKMKSLSIDDADYSRRFDEIFAESKALNQEAQELNQIAAALNQSAQSYNQEVGRLNNTIIKFNQVLAQRPEEGVYLSENDTIEVYLVANNNELVHTFAHEFGHALGIEHINDKNAIMYPFTTQVLKLSTEDKAGLQEACRERER